MEVFQSRIPFQKDSMRKQGTQKMWADLQVQTIFDCGPQKWDCFSCKGQERPNLLTLFYFSAQKDEHTSKYKTGTCHCVASFSEISLSPRNSVELSITLQGTSMNIPQFVQILKATSILYNKANSWMHYFIYCFKSNGHYKHSDRICFLNHWLYTKYKYQ